MKVTEQQGADEKLLKCSPNVNADVVFKSLFKVDVSSRSKKSDIGYKLE